MKRQLPLAANDFEVETRFHDKYRLTTATSLTVKGLVSIVPMQREQFASKVFTFLEAKFSGGHFLDPDMSEVG